MPRRAAIAVCLICLMAGPTEAADESPENDCVYQLMKAEALVYGKIESKALSEAEAEEVTEMLDEADAACTEGNFDDARATLKTVTIMMTKPSRAPDG